MEAANPLDTHALLPCLAPGCSKVRKSGDAAYCSMHRARLHRTGRLSKKRPIDRLLERVTKTVNGCWEYTGYRNSEGYGRLRADGKKELAHRLAYMAMKGPIPPGMLVCHQCDNPKCVNPDHLWLGTDLDNVKDSVIKGRKNYREIGFRRWAVCPTFKKA